MGQRFSGDLIVLPDGDLLALTPSEGLPQGFSSLVRISTAGVATTLGTVRSAYGMTTSGGAVYLPSSDGPVRRLDSAPTATGTDPQATQVKMVKATLKVLPRTSR